MNVGVGGGGCGGTAWVVFLVAGSSHVFIFTCLWLKTLLKMMVFARNKGKKKLKKDEKLLEVGITISVGCCDISTKMLAMMKKFIEDRCVSRLCALERGGSLSRLHLQMMCLIYISNVIALSKLIKKALGWDDVIIVSLGNHVHCKLLKGVGMIGYCSKDQGEKHFQFCHMNVNFEKMQGVDEYVKYGSWFCKNKVCLTHSNIMEKVATFCKYNMKKKIGSTLLGVLLEMLRSGLSQP
jgi:hypothetical protein